jgi:hypothetical protein
MKHLRAALTEPFTIRPMTFAAIVSAGFLYGSFRSQILVGVPLSATAQHVLIQALGIPIEAAIVAVLFIAWTKFRRIK